MEDITLDDLQQLYLSSYCQCDNCTMSDCEDCNLWEVQNKVRTVLKRNGYDVGLA